MADDWALLKAEEPIKEAYWIPLATEKLRSGARVSAVGFAPQSITTKETHEHHSLTRQLLIHDECEVINTDSRPVISNCVARRGASGGAILSRTNGGSVRLSGVISAGDSKSVVVYYPTASLIERVHSLR